MNEHSPAMQQYRACKAEVGDALVLFQIGDFYELFEEDARKASEVLGITLTERKRSMGEPIPMAGVPVQSAEAHLAKLVKQGIRVAVCDQIEARSATEKVVVERKITRLLTPGTLTDEALVDAREDSVLAAIRIEEDGTRALAAITIASGNFEVEEYPDDASVLAELARMQPSEVLVDEGELRAKGWAVRNGVDRQWRCTPVPPWQLETEAGRRILIEQLRTRDLRAFGCEDLDSGIGAAGCALAYARTANCGPIPHIRSIRRQAKASAIVIDPVSRRNLEIEQSIDGDEKRSLVGVLDGTRTPMGARLLRRWIRSPLRNDDEIRARHEFIEATLEAGGEERIGARLRGIGDTERILARVATKRARPGDLVRLRASLERLPEIGKELEGLKAPRASQLRTAIGEFPELVQFLRESIQEEPAASVQDGGVVRPGFDQGLDELLATAENAGRLINELEERERRRTGISRLRVGHNHAQGYFLEVPRDGSDEIPPGYVRQRTLKNAERFVSPELKELELRVVTARQDTREVEEKIYAGIVKRVAQEGGRLLTSARAISEVDVLTNFAARAEEYSLRRPAISEGSRIEIRAGRHLVVEQCQADPFVPNDLTLNDERRMLVITGPNMGGKSTYMRQAAQIVLLARSGSFVPAEQAIIGAVDRIFTRIGAGDDLSGGRSTFMVEMSETANILRNATRDSLVLIDEIGRGTSTYDGLAIAWATGTELVQRIGALTLFATHYFELTELEAEHDCVANVHFRVTEHNGAMVLLHQAAEGAARRSYGLEVASLAGVPKRVIAQARGYLEKLEREGN